MKNVILYGGAFNPPTLAHQSILEVCIKRAKQIGAQVWVVPSGNREDKIINGSIKHRIELVQALIHSVADGSIVRIEDIELKNNHLTHTFATYTALREQNPHTEFIWVFGADSIATMKGWSHGDELWNQLQILIVPRQGYALDELPSQATLLTVAPPIISSTHVRSLMAHGNDYGHLVPAKIYSLLQNKVT